MGQQPTASDHRCTPLRVITAVQAWKPIDVDPCWNPGAVVRPPVRYDGNGLGDGLTASWAARPGKCVWVNGPWSDLVPWARSAVGEHIRHGSEILFWAPCYPETEWARLLYRHAAAVCFWRRRVHHPLDPAIEAEINAERAQEGKKPLGRGSMWPTQLIYLGEQPASFRDHFDPAYGTVMFPGRAA